MSLPELNKMPPAFSLKDQDGNTVKLRDFKGESPVVLYFYPKDDTPGCTTQACGLRDEFKAIEKLGAVVLGVSPDGDTKHQKFIKKYELPFTLLCDEDHAVAEKYGVWGLKKFMGREFMGILRTTFIIGADGKLKHVFEKVKVKDHTQNVLDALKELS